MCHVCLSNMNTSGYLTTAPCGEPIFVEYPLYSPGFGRGNPWVNDLFTYDKFPYMNLDYLDECPCKNAGPLI